MRAALASTRAKVTALIAATVLLASLVGAHSMSDGKKIDLYADFMDASPLIVGNDVKVAGVAVGKIESIKVTDGHARVGMSIEKDALPLHVDAKATVRPVSLLGERFVDLDRGSADAAALPEGGVISLHRTGNATDLDEVLNALDRPTGQALAAFLTTSGQGLANRGGRAARALKLLAPSMKDTRSLVSLLDGQSAMLTRLIDSLTPVMQALGTRKGRSLDGLVSSLDKVLAATAGNRKELDSTIARLPGALLEARKTLAVLRQAAEAARPTLAGMRPTTDNLVALSKELTVFSEAGEPALQALNPLLDKTKDLLDAAGPVAASLRRSSSDLQSTVHGARPVVTQLVDNLGNVLDFLKFWALTTNNQDGLSNYFRSHAVVTSEPVTGLLPQGGGTPAQDGKTGEIKGLLSDLTQGLGLPDLGLTDGLPSLPLLGGPLGRSTTGSSITGGETTTTSRTSGSLTGLSSVQEQSLVTYLLGGSA